MVPSLRHLKILLLETVGFSTNPGDVLSSLRISPRSSEELPRVQHFNRADTTKTSLKSISLEKNKNQPFRKRLTSPTHPLPAFRANRMDTLHPLLQAFEPIILPVTQEHFFQLEQIKAPQGTGPTKVFLRQECQTFLGSSQRHCECLCWGPWPCQESDPLW